MKEFVEKLIGRLEEEREISYADFYEYLMKYELYNDFDEDDDWFYKGLIRAISIVNQLAEEYKEKDCSKCSRRSWYQKGYADAENKLAEEMGVSKMENTNILSELNKFLKEKFEYCAEQAGMNLEAECECNSEISSYFCERKELYLDRANIYGDIMREIDRLSEEYGKDTNVTTNNGWISVKDRLPTEEGSYLVVGKTGGATVTRWYNPNQFHPQGKFGGNSEGYIRYWMPRPQPPVEKGAGE